MAVFIIPSIAMASWWNPFSWFNDWTFHKQETVLQVQVEVQKTPEEKINELQKQLDDLKNQQSTSASTATTPAIKEIKNSKKSIESKKETTSIIPPTSRDKYGMTDTDWATEIASIPTAQERINSNNKYITQTEEYITSLDSSIKTISGALESEGFLNNTGKRYAQNYIDLAQELKSGYRKEIDLIKSINNIISQIITATYNHNKDSMEELGKTFTSSSEELNTLIKQDVSLFTQQSSAFNTFYNYLKLYNQSSFSSIPTYTPTYIPTYYPSSSAISECAYVFDLLGFMSFIEAQYAKCLQEHS